MYCFTHSDAEKYSLRIRQEEKAEAYLPFFLKKGKRVEGNTPPCEYYLSLSGRDTDCFNFPLLCFLYFSNFLK